MYLDASFRSPATTSPTADNGTLVWSMAALSKSEIIKSKPIGEGLAAFHEAFRSSCIELGVPASTDGVQQIIDRGGMDQNATGFC